MFASAGGVKDLPGMSGKRVRNSSSDTEDKVTQDRKRDKQFDMSGNEDNPAMATVFESGSGITNALNAKLSVIIQGQDKLREELNNNFLKQSRQLEDMIDNKLSGLRQEIDGKLAAITQDILEVQARVLALETNGGAAVGGDDGGVDAQEVQDLRRRLEAMETGVVAEAGRSRDTLVVKGFQEDTGETDADLVHKCEQLLTQLQVQVQVTVAQRLGSVGQGRRPRPVAMTLATHEAVKQVMRNKRRLKDVQAYSAVYVEPMRPAEVRSMEANIRRLTKEHPTLEYRRGRVRPRDAQQGNGPAPNH